MRRESDPRCTCRCSAAKQKCTLMWRSQSQSCRVMCQALTSNIVKHSPRMLSKTLFQWFQCKFYWNILESIGRGSFAKSSRLWSAGVCPMWPASSPYLPYCFQCSQRSCRSHASHCFCSSVSPIQLPVLSAHCSFLVMLCILEAHYIWSSKKTLVAFGSHYSLYRVVRNMLKLCTREVVSLFVELLLLSHRSVILQARSRVSEWRQHFFARSPQIWDQSSIHKTNSRK